MVHPGGAGVVAVPAVAAFVGDLVVAAVAAFAGDVVAAAAAHGCSCDCII